MVGHFQVFFFGANNRELYLFWLKFLAFNRYFFVHIRNELERLFIVFLFIQFNFLWCLWLFGKTIHILIRTMRLIQVFFTIDKQIIHTVNGLFLVLNFHNDFLRSLALNHVLPCIILFFVFGETLRFCRLALWHIVFVVVVVVSDIVVDCLEVLFCFGLLLTFGFLLLFDYFCHFEGSWLVDSDIVFLWGFLVNLAGLL